MAYCNLKFKNTILDKAIVTGILSDDMSTLTYIDEIGTESHVSITDLLSAFINKDIEISISVKSKDN